MFIIKKWEYNNLLKEKLEKKKKEDMYQNLLQQSCSHNNILVIHDNLKKLKDNLNDNDIVKCQCIKCDKILNYKYSSIKDRAVFVTTYSEYTNVKNLRNIYFDEPVTSFAKKLNRKI